jgi:bacteriorhodopsin
MVTATFVFLGLAYTKPREHRVFHYITAAITMTASIAYFSMASNIGWAPISVEFVRSNPKVAGLAREIFYVRYIDWVITTPLLLLDLLLTAGLPAPTIAWVIFIDEVMIICGLVGALVRSSYKWGYFTFGCAALLYIGRQKTFLFSSTTTDTISIGYVLLVEARANANRINREVGKTFLLCGTWTFALWCLYPIAWGLAEGGNVIAPDSEAVFYGVLDFCAKPVFGALLIWGHRNIDPAELGMHIEDAGHNRRGEKTYNEGPGGFGNAANNTSDYTSGGMRNTLRKKNRNAGANSGSAAPTTDVATGADAHV